MEEGSVYKADHATHEHEGIRTTHVFMAPGTHRVTVTCLVEHLLSLERHTYEVINEVDCLYVRRELRDLISEDRNAFLDAFQVSRSVCGRGGG